MDGNVTVLLTVVRMLTVLTQTVLMTLMLLTPSIVTVVRGYC